jgi:hypothetical protein
MFISYWVQRSTLRGFSEQERMKTKTLQSIVLAIVCICSTEIANCQTSTNDLAVSAEAQLLMDSDDPRVFLNIHLINLADHEVTVLTKDLNIEIQRSANQMTFVVGYANPAVTHNSHAIVPSLYAFLPVTLKPNEEAFISKEVAGMRDLKQVTPEVKFVVRYTISLEWAKRFSLWNGSVESKAFNARLKKPR